MEIIVNSLVALTILAQVSIIFIISESIYVASRQGRSHSPVLRFLHKYAMHIAFLVSLISMLGSLYYSDVLKYAPCVLCWYQRIAMYPLVFLFAMSIWRKENKVWILIAPLLILGIFFSGTHYYLQLSENAGFCEVVGNYSVSCSETFSTHLGYITIPLMAFSAFVLILGLSILQRKNLNR